MARRVLSSVSLKMEISLGRRRAKRGCLIVADTDRGMTSWWLGEAGSDWARGRSGGGGRTGPARSIVFTGNGPNGLKIGKETTHVIVRWTRVASSEGTDVRRRDCTSDLGDVFHELAQ